MGYRVGTGVGDDASSSTGQVGVSPKLIKTQN